MKYLILTFTVAIIASCAARTEIEPDAPTVSRPRPMPTASPNQTLRPQERIDVDLQRQLEEIAIAAEGRVGVGAVMLETGDAVYLDRTGHFAMQSVYKLPIAMTVAQMIDQNAVRIDQDISITPGDYVRKGFHSPIRNLNPQGTIMPLVEIMGYSISESDGTASDVLLDTAGGPAPVKKYLDSIGIKDLVVAHSEKEISRDWTTQYLDWATPEASVDLLRALFDRRAGLSEQTTDLLLGMMTNSDTGYRRIRRGLPEGAILAHKTGTGGTEDEIPGYKKDKFANTNRIAASKNNIGPANTSKVVVGTKERPVITKNNRRGAKGDPSDPANAKITSATNDIGIITLPDGRHIILAVYIMDSSADGPTRERVIADIAKAVCEKWGR